jgi:hypothetical protein
MRLHRQPARWRDRILDSGNASGNNDVIRIFVGGLSLGILAAGRCEVRADNLAQDADDRFIFRTTDQTLWFDVNGTGVGGLSLIADLQASAVMSAADIYVFSMFPVGVPGPQ